MWPCEVAALCMWGLLMGRRCGFAVSGQAGQGAGLVASGLGPSAL